MRWAFIAWLAAAGCIDPSLTPCGAVSCPAGTVCVADQRCATPSEVQACAGLAEGAPCSVNGGVGACEQGACVAAGCGNGIIDPGEVCDDGNTVSGDGCRGDCKKIEVCGDGILDAGEACDDGNTNPDDGCDACRLTTWAATAIVGGGALAIDAVVDAPGGVAVDLLGNIYIADETDNRVTRIDPDGVIITVAGNGTRGSTGDGGQATNAELVPHGIAIDDAGDLYIADRSFHRIRHIDSSGIITTIAGNGTPGFTGDSGLATAAELQAPSGVAVDGLGNVFIADTTNARIRRVALDGTISTVAGGGAAGDGNPAIGAQLVQPLGIVVDTTGALYIADAGAHTIRYVNPAGIISTIAGNGTAGATGDNGPATAAELHTPDNIALAGGGAFYIADTLNNKIRFVDAGGMITTVAGTGIAGDLGDGGPAASAEMSEPSAVALDGNGGYVVTEVLGDFVRHVDAGGTIKTICGSGFGRSSGDGFAGTSFHLPGPEGVAIGPDGSVYFADSGGSNRIQRIDAAGTLTTVAGNGTSTDSGDGGPASSAGVPQPFGIGFDHNGGYYIAEANTHRVRYVDAGGTITTIAGTGVAGALGDGGLATSAELDRPQGVAVDSIGNVYIADTSNHEIRRVDPGGTITTVAGIGTAGFNSDGIAATTAQLSGPLSVAVDPDDVLYIADTGNNRLRMIDAMGNIQTVAGTGVAGYNGDNIAGTTAEIKGPSALVIDPTGAVYMIDETSRVRLLANGTITTVAGTGTVAPIDLLVGDGGPATSAELGTNQVCQGLALDALGRLYVSDRDNNAIRRIELDGRMISLAGPIDPVGMGPAPEGQLVDPRQLIATPTYTFVAGGTTGTVQGVRDAYVTALAGRYATNVATGNLARFRTTTFGTVGGIAFDPNAQLLYLVETDASRIDIVTIVDPLDSTTWTFAPFANTAGTAGYADGAVATALFRNPTGLTLDGGRLYVADTGNHAIRVIDLASGMVSTIAGTPQTRGFFGDGGPATGALLFSPSAITTCPDGDVFIADTANQRVRRIAAGTGTISTVLGNGAAASAGDGSPASTFAVNAPRGLACDAVGNVFVTSTTSVRLLAADANGVVDGSGVVETIYGLAVNAFPERLTHCLTGITIVDDATVQAADECTGVLVQLHRDAQ